MGGRDGDFGVLDWGVGLEEKEGVRCSGVCSLFVWVVGLEM